MERIGSKEIRTEVWVVEVLKKWGEQYRGCRGWGIGRVGDEGG